MGVMGFRKGARLGEYTFEHTGERGQMTVELAVAFPVLIIVAVIAVNALTFVSECASFDRVFGEIVRVHASSRAYGISEEGAIGDMSSAMKSSFPANNVDIRIEVANVGLGCREYSATMQFAPTLFGLGLRDDVFGVPLPRICHRASCVVDPYKPGVFI